MVSVLGLSFDYHNSAAALVVDGELLAAAQEERFSRTKNDPGFPHQAIKFCLRKADLYAKDIDYIVFYENPRLKFSRIIETSENIPNKKVQVVESALRHWVAKEKFFPEQKISHFLEIKPEKVSLVNHHLAHAASAFFASPFQEAAIVTIDGVGEKTTSAIYSGNGQKISEINKTEYPNSVGLFYSAITAFLGFEVNEGEYKVMGMAAYGEPKYEQKMRELFTLFDDGTFVLDQSLFEFNNPIGVPYSKEFISQYGPAREAEAIFDPEGRENKDYRIITESKFYADIAASAQKTTEHVIKHITNAALRITENTNLCMAGGVALNSVANGLLRKNPDLSLFVQPESGDAGSALGAAYAKYVEISNLRPTWQFDVSLGYEASEKECHTAIQDAGLTNWKLLESEEEMLVKAAENIADGRVLGWFQGGAEWGPRALGYRSILANAGFAQMAERVNKRVKFRERFRPFAPSVLAEYATDYFVLPEFCDEASPESFMLSVCQTRPDKRELLPAVTHVDGSARVHLVHKTINPIFHKLIEKCKDLTGIPVVLNTSFNRRGEPIVNTPADAISAFVWSDLDILYLGLFEISKEDFSY